MSSLPHRPFLTRDFSLRGGGIDFLGLRYVNLHILGSNLIPELNNVTRDMGTFFVGAWIPWKFAQVCQKNQYTERNYRAFREKAEVALSLTMRDQSTASQKHGAVRNRVGITQKCQLPSELNFKRARRRPENTLYAAAIYGPALRALGLIDSYWAQAENYHTLDIAVAASDQDTKTILESLDRELAKQKAYKALTSLDSPKFTWGQIDALGAAGLCPSASRSRIFRAAKQCFQRKLLPVEPESLGYARTLTARLLLATLNQKAPLPTYEIRNTWYTGSFGNGKKLRLKDDDLKDQRARWSLFMARQYQRYAIELFLWCFEIALREGSRCIDDAIDYWERRTKDEGLNFDGSFRDIMRSVASDLYSPDDLETSAKWNKTVHGEHDLMEYVEEPQNNAACVSGLRMFAGWYWRMLFREHDADHKDLMTLGQSDRMSMSWFLDWLRRRQNMPVREMLKDIFSDLVFSQHMRVALSRFDGTAQRLRFVLGDSGIEPTVSAKSDLGNRGLPWMPDRLDTLAELMCDIDVLTMNDQGAIELGPRSNTVPNA